MSVLPSINRLVHYVSFGTPGGEYAQACRSALITGVGAWLDDEVRELDGSDRQRRMLLQSFDHMAIAATVFNPTGHFLHQALRYDEGAELGAVYGEHFEPGRSLLCTGRAHTGGTWHWPVLA